MCLEKITVKGKQWKYREPNLTGLLCAGAAKSSSCTQEPRAEKIMGKRKAQEQRWGQA